MNQIGKQKRPRKMLVGDWRLPRAVTSQLSIIGGLGVILSGQYEEI